MMFTRALISRQGNQGLNRIFKMNSICKMSSAGQPTLQDMAAYLAPVEQRIAEYRLDLETDPGVLDRLCTEGKISKHTADYFKDEIHRRQKHLGRLSAHVLHHADIFPGRKWNEIKSPVLVLWHTSNHRFGIKCLFFGN